MKIITTALLFQFLFINYFFNGGNPNLFLSKLLGTDIWQKYQIIFESTM